MDPRIRRLVEKLWTYHQLNHQLAHADVILVLCSHDRAVAERGAQLLLEDWAPLLIFSGGLGSITKHLWNEPEANQFAEIAMRMGVAPEKILIENRSTNTGENVLFTKQLLAGKGIDPHTFIVVQKPYMERRSYATFRKLWPEKELLVTSPRVSLGRIPRQVLERIAFEGRCRQHHGGRSPAAAPVSRQRIPDSAGDSRRRLASVTRSWWRRDSTAT